MCTGPGDQRPQILPAVMYVFLTAQCIVTGSSLLSEGPLDTEKRIPGSGTVEVLLHRLMLLNHRHSDLIAVLLKTSEAATENPQNVYGRKSSFMAQDLFFYKHF